jgi:FKBP-type peptidyl-prolyl cis-trans isomerase 2
MNQAKNGDTVKVHYTGKLEDGTVFDTSKDREPLEFTIGDGSVIPGFEKGIIGMEIGSKKIVTIPPEEAYGQRHKELILKVEKNNFPENVTPAVGMELQLKYKDKTSLRAVITDIEEERVTLDANHPLAEKTLIFDIELVKIA